MIPSGLWVSALSHGLFRKALAGLGDRESYFLPLPQINASSIPNCRAVLELGQASTRGPFGKWSPSSLGLFPSEHRVREP